MPEAFAGETVAERVRSWPKLAGLADVDRERVVAFAEKKDAKISSDLEKRDFGIWNSGGMVADSQEFPCSGGLQSGENCSGLDPKHL